MADRRPDDQNESRAKRLKPSPSSDMDPKANPYLAHMYGDSAYHNNDPPFQNSSNSADNASPLARFPRHRTTAAIARKVEDGPDNPFTGRPLSGGYFSVLKTRRDLPVHAQR